MSEDAARSLLSEFVDLVNDGTSAEMKGSSLEINTQAPEQEDLRATALNMTTTKQNDVPMEDALVEPPIVTDAESSLPVSPPVSTQKKKRFAKKAPLPDYLKDQYSWDRTKLNIMEDEIKNESLKIDLEKLEKQKLELDTHIKEAKKIMSDPNMLLNRLRRRIDRLRYERSGEKPLEIDHLLCHFPADPNCPGCEAAKRRKTPAITLTQEQRDATTALHDLDRVRVDIVGPTRPGLNGHRFALVTRDDCTNFLKVAKMRNKEMDTV